MRAFDLDERLVGVAFLDVGVYVTSLRSMKNALLIGDAVKGVWFVAFQVSHHIRHRHPLIVAERNTGRSIQACCIGKVRTTILHH